LALFGSTARDEARADGDVDLLAEFDGPMTLDRYMGLNGSRASRQRLPKTKIESARADANAHARWIAGLDPSLELEPAGQQPENRFH
jgi:hypothetical protein